MSELSESGLWMNDQRDDTASYETRSRGTAAGLFGIGGSILAAGQPMSVSFGSALGLGIGLTLLGIGAYYWFPRRLRCEGGGVKFPIRRAIPLDPFTAFISVPASGEGYTQGPRIVLVPIEGGRQRTIQVRRYGFPDAAAVWLEARLRRELPQLWVDSPEAQALLPAKKKPARQPARSRRPPSKTVQDPEADRYVSDYRSVSLWCVVFAGVFVITWFVQNGSAPLTVWDVVGVLFVAAMLIAFAVFMWIRDEHECRDGVLTLSRTKPIQLPRFIGFVLVPPDIPGDQIGARLYLIPEHGEETPWVWLDRHGLGGDGANWLRANLRRSLEELWHYDDAVRSIVEHHNAVWTKDARNLREHEGYVQFIPAKRERFVKPMLRALRYLTTFERRGGKAADRSD